MPGLPASQTEEFLAFAHRLADAAGAVTLRYFRTPLDVTNKLKTGFDPVTLADEGAETAIRTLIEKTYPTHGIFGEEHGKRESTSGLTWVIDPIDGTRAFITGSPLWGTLIALSDERGPIIGMLDQPFLGERLWGVRGGGSSYARGGKISALKTRECTGLEDAAFSTTTPEMFDTPPKAVALAALHSRVKLQRFGGDCYQYGLIAMGYLDLVMEAGLKPYDIQALIPIIEGAGGVVTTWDGAPAHDGGNIIAAGDPRTHRAALEVLQAAGR